MATPDVFARRIRELAEAVEPRAGEAQAAVAERVGRAVVRATPIDTALARSNWVASADQPDLSPRAPRSANETIDEIRSRVSAIAAFGRGQNIVIANGGDKVPYIARLDAGSSTQAPAGFVREAAQAGSAALNNFRILRRFRGGRRG